MHHKTNFGKILKPVCYGNAAVRISTIPVTLINAQILSRIIDYAISGRVTAVIKNALIMLVLTLSFTLFQTSANILLRRRQAKSVNQCRLHFLEMLLTNPLCKLFPADYGELTENLNNDIDTAASRYIELYPDILASTLTLTGYLAFLFFKSPVAAVSLAAVAMLQLFPPFLVKKYMQINYDRDREMEAKITNHIAAAVNGFEVIKLYGLKKWWMTRLSDYHKKYLQLGRKADATAAAQTSMSKLLDHILRFGTYALLGIYALTGYCAPDTAIQAIYLSGGLYSSVKSIFSTIPGFAVARSAEKRICKWLCPAHKAKKTSTDSDISMSEDIIAKNLWYSFHNTPILCGIGYHFENGKNYLIKGINGAGKTTFLNLLTGLLLPSDGNISVCGQLTGQTTAGNNTGFSGWTTTCDTTTFHRAPYVLYILQYDPEYTFTARTLFTMFGDAAWPSLHTIARRLGLTDDHINSHAICTLSGGERKKVFLSIGFALNPHWLLLDEPSNNLDLHGQQVLIELIRERKGTLFVSHDLSLCETSDCIITLENGRIYDENINSNN